MRTSVRTVANALKMGKQVDPKTFKHASILYSDIVGFTSLCSESQPMEVQSIPGNLHYSLRVFLDRSC